MINLIIQLPILLFSVIAHEVAHGWVAERFGDHTARAMGRLTFNPGPHIDMFGTILLPALCAITGAPVFGWAKPVPVNPNYLNDPKRDMIWVSLAGPGANFALAIIAAFGMYGLRLTGSFSGGPELYLILSNLLVINVILPVFNLIPIPPLDGSKVVMGLLPYHLAYKYSQMEYYGFFIIIILLTSGVLSRILGPIVSIIVYYLGGSGMYL